MRPYKQLCKKKLEPMISREPIVINSDSVAVALKLHVQASCEKTILHRLLVQGSSNDCRTNGYTHVNLIGL